jgi:hypothetical protein
LLPVGNPAIDKVNAHLRANSESTRTFTAADLRIGNEFGRSTFSLSLVARANLPLSHLGL